MSVEQEGTGHGTGLVTVAYARALLDHLRVRGINPASIYPASRIEAVESPNGRSRIPLAQWLEMIEAAITVTQDSDLPLKVGMGITARHIGLLAYVVMSCADFQEAASQLTRYSRLVGDISHTQLQHRGRKVEVVWQWAYDTTPPAAASQLQLAARVALARWLLDRPEMKFTAYFRFKRPANTALYNHFFGETTRFSQAETKLVFSSEYLNAPVITADPIMQKMAAAQAETLLKSLASEPDFLRELKGILMRGLVVGRVSLATSADAMNTSARSLQRKLDEHRCSFRQILDEVRHAEAKRYLADPCVSLAQVAFMLGYSEQSTFQNAFKRWAGMTPRDFRASVL